MRLGVVFQGTARIFRPFFDILAFREVGMVIRCPGKCLQRAPSKRLEKRTQDVAIPISA
jgi:hypothetical protein